MKAFCPILGLVPSCLALAFVLLFLGKAGICIKLSIPLYRLTSRCGRIIERLSFSLFGLETFSASLGSIKPISFRLVVMKARSDGRKLQFKKKKKTE